LTISTNFRWDNPSWRRSLSFATDHTQRFSNLGNYPKFNSREGNPPRERHKIRCRWR